jgi:uncharacterized protein YjbJ (UPF0337 family)
VSWSFYRVRLAKSPAVFRNSINNKAVLVWHSECSVQSGETIMNWDRVEGNWKEFKGKAKQQWGKLTDDDMTRLSGKKDELSGKIQERYGYSKDQADRELDEWVSSQDDSVRTR